MRRCGTGRSLQKPEAVLVSSHPAWYELNALTSMPHAPPSSGLRAQEQARTVSRLLFAWKPIHRHAIAQRISTAPKTGGIYFLAMAAEERGRKHGVHVSLSLPACSAFVLHSGTHLRRLKSFKAALVSRSCRLAAIVASARPAPGSDCTLGTAKGAGTMFEPVPGPTPPNLLLPRSGPALHCCRSHERLCQGLQLAQAARWAFSGSRRQRPINGSRRLAHPPCSSSC